MEYLVSFFLWLNIINPSSIIKPGDILFQDLDCGDLCDAIEQATYGYKNYTISHVGFVVIHNDEKYVLEAYGSVKLTPLSEFLNRSKDEKGNPKVIVARIKRKYKKLLPLATDYGLKLLRKPYDEKFLLNNGSYYCSELIYEMFKYACQGKDFFPVYPMNFRSLKDGTMPQVWKEYFDRLGIDIPQGELGCNPADYSRSQYLRIIAVLGSIPKNHFLVK